MVTAKKKAAAVKKSRPPRDRERLTPSQQLKFRQKLLEEQGGLCALCGYPISKDKKNHPLAAALDHDHKTGRVRAVLHFQCNVLEAKNFNSLRKNLFNPTDEQDLLRLRKLFSGLVDYWIADYSSNPLHMSHRTPEEKNFLKNIKAQARRKRKKEQNAS